MNPRKTRVFVFVVSGLCVAIVSAAAGGCGGGNSRNSPPPPAIHLAFKSFLVDLGARFELDATDPANPADTSLQYSWSAFHTTASPTFDSRCKDDDTEICVANDDDPCADDPTIFCTSNADCPTGQCTINGGTTSSDCTTGKCEVGLGDRQKHASFVADAPGPYNVRLVIDDGSASNTKVVELDTYPTLFLVGSLTALGGTQGALIGEFGDSATFAQGAIRAASNPSGGNLLVIVSDQGAGVVREFDLHSGSAIGAFGETSSFVVDPVALAFDSTGRLFVADSNGDVRIFGGSGASKGLFIKKLGDVAGAGESVSSILFSPVSGELLVVDGGAGQGIRRYNASTGAFLGVLGQTATAVAQAVDAAFLPSFVCRHDNAVSCDLDADCEALVATSKCIPGAAAALLVADRAGDVIRCNTDGTACASFGTVSASLANGGPTAIEVNPSGGATDAKVLVADGVNQTIVGCNGDGSVCSDFGGSTGLTSAYSDVFFAPPQTPTTTSTTITLP